MTEIVSTSQRNREQVDGYEGASQRKPSSMGSRESGRNPNIDPALLKSADSSDHMSRTALERSRGTRDKNVDHEPFLKSDSGLLSALL